MSVKAQVDAILNKKMDRQGFIKHLAIGVIAVSGISSALRLLAPNAQKRIDTGYGGAAYGGTKSTD